MGSSKWKQTHLCVPAIEEHQGRGRGQPKRELASSPAKHPPTYTYTDVHRLSFISVRVQFVQFQFVHRLSFIVSSPPSPPVTRLQEEEREKERERERERERKRERVCVCVCVCVCSCVRVRVWLPGAIPRPEQLPTTNPPLCCFVFVCCIFICSIRLFLVSLLFFFLGSV